MGDPHGGAPRIIAPALWALGGSRIESTSIVLDPSDADHYNGLPDLLDRFAVGEVRVAPGFGGSANPEAVRLLDRVRARGIPIAEIARGDALPLAGGQIKVVHPPRTWGEGLPDNARSVVLLATAPGGDGLLLTGDLEGPGLAELASKDRLPAATMLAPHHGGRTSNPEWFHDWAGARRIVVSQRRPAATDRDALADLRGVRVDRTWDIGAIRIKLGATRKRASRAALVPVGWRAALALLGVAAGLMLFAVSAVVEWGAWTLVMPGRRLGGSAVEPFPWEPIEVSAKDGARLHGARLAADPSRGLIAFLHGFGEDRNAMRGRAETMHRRGWTVAVLDTRGRGRSEGDRTAFGGREAVDLHAWLDLLGGPTVAWGRSMGAAIAARAAVEDERIAGVILEAPYADLRGAVAAWIARLRVPRWLALPILWRAERLAGVSLHDPRPIDVARSVRVPVLVLHGGLDPVAPPAEARRLAAAFPVKAVVVEVADAGHGNVFDQGGESLVTRLDEFAANAVAQ